MLTKLGLLPEQASTFAARVDALYYFLIGISLFFSLLIMFLILRFAVRYRRSAGRPTEQISGSLPLEVLWTVVPFVLTMFIFFWGARIYLSMARPPENSLEIFVVGKQWMWKVQHFEGRREIDEIHVPVGRPVKLTMTSEDVIHSFYVPAFRIKADVLPGRYTTTWFEATKTGTYRLFCAEYCGTAHSRMIGRIIVQEPYEYDAWLKTRRPLTKTAVPAAPAELSMAAMGALLYERSGCGTCHLADPSFESSDMTGPPLYAVYRRQVSLADGVSIVADDDYLRRAILDPMVEIVRGYDALMPTYEGQLSEVEVLQLVAYLKSLSGTAPAAVGLPSSKATASRRES